MIMADNNGFKLTYNWNGIDFEEKSEFKHGIEWILKPSENKLSLVLEIVVPPLTTAHVELSGGLKCYIKGTRTLGFADCETSRVFRVYVNILEIFSSKCLTDAGDDISDIVLMVDNVKFYVHKKFLSVLSPVFKSMFYENQQEASIDEVELTEKDATLFGDFLTVLYNIHPIGENHQRAYSLYPLFAEYQVNCYLNQCLELIENSLNKPCPAGSINYDILEIAVIAENFDLKEIYDKAISSITLIPCDDLLKSKTFSKLSDKAHAEIFMKN